VLILIGQTGGQECIKLLCQWRPKQILVISKSFKSHRATSPLHTFVIAPADQNIESLSNLTCNNVKIPSATQPAKNLMCRAEKFFLAPHKYFNLAGMLFLLFRLDASIDVR